jgi:hypothetical protein
VQMPPQTMLEARALGQQIIAVTGL